MTNPLTHGPEAPINLAFIDLGLPDNDSYDVVRQLRDLHRSELMLGALTRYADPDHHGRALTSGFAYHTTKPITLEDLESLFSIAARGSVDVRSAIDRLAA